jgi:gliding motility-associated-like protein
MHHYSDTGSFVVELNFFTNGGVSKVKKTLKVEPHLPLAIDLGDDIVLCEGDSVTLEAPPVHGTYLWSDGSANPKRTIDTAGVYSLKVTNACGSAYDTVNISYSKLPEIRLPRDTLVCRGQPASINVNKVPGLTYTWNTGDQSSSLTITPFENSKIDLNIKNELGCEKEYSMLLNVNDCFPKIIIPNAFTPNADNINDAWIIKNIEYYPNAEVYIYTRSGENIFGSKGYQVPWNGTYSGKLLPTAAYYYVIMLNDGSPAYTGEVSIYR